VACVPVGLQNVAGSGETRATSSARQPQSCWHGGFARGPRTTLRTLFCGSYLADSMQSKLQSSAGFQRNKLLSFCLLDLLISKLTDR